MGPFFSKSTTYSTDVSGSHVNLWIINGRKFDILSIFNQTIQNAVEKVGNIISANNPVIIINIMLILTIDILLIIFLYLRYRYQQFPPKINFNSNSFTNSLESSTSNDKSLSKNIPSCTTGYLV